MITVKLLLVGMIAVAYEDDKTVILVRDSQQPFYCSHGACVEPHHPILAWAAECRGDSCPPDEEHHSSDSCGENPATYLTRGNELKLDRHDFSVRGDIEASSESSTKLEKVPLELMKRIMNWLKPASRSIHEHWITTKPPVASGLAARITLPQGVVKAVHLIDRGCPGKTLRLTAGNYSGPMPDVTLMEFSVPDDSLKLTYSVPEASGSHDLELAPLCGVGSDTDGNGEIDNCLILLLVTNQPPQLATKPDPADAHHFERYYHLSKREPRLDKKHYPSVTDLTPPGAHTREFACDATKHIAQRKAQDLDDLDRALLCALAHKDKDDFETCFGRPADATFASSRLSPDFLKLFERRAIGSRPICPEGGY